MQDCVVRFAVTRLEARIGEELKVHWEGKELDPGPLNIELDRAVDASNTGVLDYDRHRAKAEFSVLLSFPEFASTLGALGIDPALTRPVRAVIYSEGEILDDHSFRLSGPCEVGDHALLNGMETRASILPGI